VAWTGTTHAAVAGPVLPGPPHGFAFVRQRWFRWVVLGQALTVLPAILSGTTGGAWWSWISVLGYLAFMAGSVMVVTRYLELDRIAGRRALTWIGIGSGVVAFGVGFGLETLVDHVAGWSTTLWLTGPIEEGGKLLVPLLLLAFGAPVFKIPWVGLYLVLVSGATVGVLEGAEYEARPEFAWAHLQMAMVRPSAELLHVFVTGFAAAVIWLAAWRRRRTVTGAGIVAFLIAAGIHSLHDGSSPSSTCGHRRSTRRWPTPSARRSSRACRVRQWPWYSPCSSTSWPGTGRGSSPPQDASPPARRRGAPRSRTGDVTRLRCPRLLSSRGRVPAAPARWEPRGRSLHPGLVPVTVPTVAPPGWYAIGGDPALQGWWTGTTWLRILRWDGNRWMAS